MSLTVFRPTAEMGDDHPEDSFIALDVKAAELPATLRAVVLHSREGLAESVLGRRIVEYITYDIRRLLENKGGPATLLQMQNRDVSAPDFMPALAADVRNLIALIDQRKICETDDIIPLRIHPLDASSELRVAESALRGGSEHRELQKPYRFIMSMRELFDGLSSLILSNPSIVYRLCVQKISKLLYRHIDQIVGKYDLDPQIVYPHEKPMKDAPIQAQRIHHFQAAIPVVPRIMLGIGEHIRKAIVHEEPNAIDPLGNNFMEVAAAEWRQIRIAMHVLSQQENTDRELQRLIVVDMRDFLLEYKHLLHENELRELREALLTWVGGAVEVATVFGPLFL